MRFVRSLSLLLTLAACKGPSPAPSATSPTPSASASATASSSGASASTPLPDVPFEPALPAAATLMASLDLQKTNLPAVLALLDLTKTLGADFPELSLAQGSAGLAALGLDTTRPVTLAQLAITDEEVKAIAKLRTLVPPVEPKGGPSLVPPANIYASMKGPIDAIPSLVGYRVLFPAKDAKLLRTTLEKVLVKGGLAGGANGEYTGRHFLAVISGNAETLAVDITSGTDLHQGVAAIRAAVHEKHGTAPALEQDALRIACVPAQLAKLGFVNGVHTTLAAVGSPSIAPAQRDRIAYVGLWDASRSLAAAGSERGERFTSIELRIPADAAHVPSTLRAQPGPGFEGPPSEAWAPSFSVAAGSSGAMVDLSRPFLDGWKGPDGHTLLDAKGFFYWVSEGESFARLAAAPETLIEGAVGLALESFAPSPAVLARFSRFGLLPGAPAKSKGDAGHAGSDVFFGVLNDGTTRADAECVLADASPCKGHGLSLGVVAKDGDQSVVLKAVGKRFVLLRAKDPAALAIKLEASTAPPGRVAVNLRDYHTLRPLDAIGPIQGTVRRDGSTIVIEVGAR